MPLSEFTDYNDYWDQRAAKNAPPKIDTIQGAILHRYVSIAKQIPEGSSVLDIGCGDGGFLIYLKSLNKNLKLFGLDVSDAAISNLTKEGIEGKTIKIGVPLREIVDRDFDYVVMMEVIEHVHEAEALVRDTFNFHPKGIFITIPNSGFIVHRIRLMFGGRFPVTFILLHMKEHIRFWTVKDFHQWADYLNLKICNWEGQEKGTKNPLRLFLIRSAPGLFAAQLIFHLKQK